MLLELHLKKKNKVTQKEENLDTMGTFNNSGSFYHLTLKINILKLISNSEQKYDPITSLNTLFNF